MSKTLKDMMTTELRETYDGVDFACVVDLTGMNAGATYELRGLLREREIRMKVIKNRMARRAFEGGPLEPLGRLLDGPCALVTGGENAIDVARQLAEAVRKFPALKLKLGLIEGDSEVTPVEQLAAMRNLSEMRADLVGLALSPGRKLAGAIVAGGANIAACIKTIVENLEKGETESRPAA